MTIRAIDAVVAAHPTSDGAGVALRRVFGFHHTPAFDPFLLLDEFGGTRPADYEAGFPWHPHRGIETITYLLAGTVTHEDSLGNAGTIGPGDVQWMTAGSGIIHQEMPHGDAAGVLRGFQLWANLPAAKKMTPPRYQGFAAAEIPIAALPGGATARVICGTVAGVTGPVQDVTIAPEYLDVTLPAGVVFAHPVPAGHTAFAYVVDGGGVFAPGAAPVGPAHAVRFTDGDAVAITAGSDGLRFLFVAGRPLGEPVAWSGPIVMNTEAELRAAYDELRHGTFIR
jgi:redox-sensitive bicupin YhaK (pirin superfamily)